MEELKHKVGLSVVERMVFETGSHLKSDSHLPPKISLFAFMIALQK